MNWAFYILLAWIPSYLNQEYNYDLTNAGLVGLAPFFTMFVVSASAGKLSDTFIRRGYTVTRVRKVINIVDRG